MVATRVRGQQLEQIACDYLVSQGLTCLERNYHCRTGEVDLIMRQDETLVFVEVRYRKQNAYGSGATTVTRAKQRKLMSAARFYLHCKNLTHRVHSRFDVVSLASDPAKPDIDWIKSAFY